MRTRPQPGGKATELSALGASSCSQSFLDSFDWAVNLCWWAASFSLLHGFLLSIRLSRLLFLTSLPPLFHFGFASPQETSHIQPSPSLSPSTPAAGTAPLSPTVRFTSPFCCARPGQQEGTGCSAEGRTRLLAGLCSA